MNSARPIYLAAPKDSREFGWKLGTAIKNRLSDGRLSLPGLITLSGDLGAGKTTICQGLGEALGVADPGEIVSPTFALANEYKGLCDIFHLDIYRIESADQFHDAGLDEYLHRPGLCLVEWPEKMPENFWPDGRHLALNIAFQGGGRLVQGRPQPLWQELLAELA